jgi:hypothetical protein
MSDIEEMAAIEWAIDKANARIAKSLARLVEDLEELDELENVKKESA